MFGADLISSQRKCIPCWCNSIAKGELSNICFTVFNVQFGVKVSDSWGLQSGHTQLSTSAMKAVSGCQREMARRGKKKKGGGRQFWTEGL